MWISATTLGMPVRQRHIDCLSILIALTPNPAFQLPRPSLHYDNQPHPIFSLSFSHVCIPTISHTFPFSTLKIIMPCLLYIFKERCCIVDVDLSEMEMKMEEHD